MTIYQAPQIEWTEKERENIGGIAIQATTVTHTYHIFQGDLDREWICSYYRHNGGKAKFKILPTSQELKEWVETTHYPSALIKAGFKTVNEPLSDTLVEKLEQEVNRIIELKAKEKPHSLVYAFLSHHIAATVNAINIVEQHQAESDWMSVDEYRKIAKANDRVFVYDTFCEAVMPSLVRVINGRAGFQLTNGLYAMHVSHVCSMTVPKPPSEVQDD